ADIIHMKNRSSIAGVTIIGVPHVEGTNCVIRNCTISGVQNPDAIIVDTGWGNFSCFDSWLGSSYDTVAVSAPCVTSETTNSSHIGGVAQGEGRMLNFVNCYSYINAGYTNFGLARALVPSYNGFIRWQGGGIDVRNGNPHSSIIEFDSLTATTNSRVEISGAQLHYSTTNGLPVYAVYWGTNVGTCVEYGHFIHTNDTSGGTVQIVGSLPLVAG